MLKDANNAHNSTTVKWQYHSLIEPVNDETATEHVQIIKHRHVF